MKGVLQQPPATANHVAMLIVTNVGAGEGWHKQCVHCMGMHFHREIERDIMGKLTSHWYNLCVRRPGR